MTTTVRGATGAQLAINVGSNDALAQATLAAAISAALANGSLTQVSAPNQSPSTGTGLFVQTVANQTTVLGPNTSSVIFSSGGAEIGFGNGTQNQQVIADNGGLTYNTGGGSGTIIAGDGANFIATPTIGGGRFAINTGAGNDIIFAQSGANTVNAGGGVNLLLIRGNDTISLFGSTDIIVGSPGASPGNTITATESGSGNVAIAPNNENLNFVGGAGVATVFAGNGSDTITLGTGGGIVAGGLGGNNVINGGAGAAGSTLFGGGNGDLLSANGFAITTLAAGAGNETLTGANSSANNVFYGLGPKVTGSVTLQGGNGADTFIIGAPGTVSVNGGPGQDLIAIVAGGRGTVNIGNFTSAERVTLQGFASTEVARALATATVGASTSLVLADGTKVNFVGVTNLTSSSFV